MKQGDLFDEPDTPSPHPIAFCDPSLTPAERPRRSRQCVAILDRLRRGRATNRELAGLALKYSGRISDLRKSGYDVRVVERDHGSGLAVYALFVGGAEVGIAPGADAP